MNLCHYLFISKAIFSEFYSLFSFGFLRFLNRHNYLYNIFCLFDCQRAMCQVPESNRNLLFFRQSPWPPWLTWLMRLFYHVLWIRQDLNLWPSGPACRVGDRWWIWTTNLLDVNQTLYRWAKRSLWRAGCKPGALANWATDPKKYQNSVRMRGFEPPRTKASTGSSSLPVYRFQHIRST